VEINNLESFCVAIGIPSAGANRILCPAATGLIHAMEGLSSNFPKEMRPLDNLIGEMAGLLNSELGLGLALRERDAHIVRSGGWNLS
jgi:hypothetical protein